MPPDPLAKGAFSAYKDSISQKILSWFKTLWRLDSLCRNVTEHESTKRNDKYTWDTEIPNYILIDL